VFAGVDVFFTLALAACLSMPPATAPARVLWTDPGRIETIDFTAGAGGTDYAPKPPFYFLQEDSGGTSPKVIIRDARNVRWRVKGGLEVRAETFSTRFVAALGYFTETTYFLAKGKIEGVGALKRAAGFIAQDGAFTYAAFERIEPESRFLEGVTWTWIDSPFQGTPPLQGLKILMMLVSNWDNKDARDAGSGSNTSVLAVGEGQSLKHVYFVNDWGQTLGRWGDTGFFGRQSVWDCRGFAEQTRQFIRPAAGRFIRFGYAGRHVDDFSHDITAAEVRWLMQYLGRITDAQIRTGLLASGASQDDEQCFSKALRDRIEQLRRIAGSTERSTPR
jgi:hypothetical protein